MNYMKIALITILFNCWAITNKCYSQYTTHQEYTPRTTMLLTIGGPVGIASAVYSIEPKSKLPHLRIRGSIGAHKGVYYNSDQDTPGTLFLASDIVYLTRPDSRGFDFSVGVGLTLMQLSTDAECCKNARWSTFIPRFNLGYRFFTGDKFFIRASVGYPELNNVSFGYLF